MAVTSVMLHKLKTGMTIAEDVYHNSQLLIQKDTIINADVLDILNNSSVVAVAIYKENKNPNPSDKPIHREIRISHAEQVRNSEAIKKFENDLHETTETFSFQLNDIASQSGEVDIDGLFESANELMADSTGDY